MYLETTNFIENISNIDFILSSSFNSIAYYYWDCTF